MGRFQYLSQAQKKNYQHYLPSPCRKPRVEFPQRGCRVGVRFSLKFAHQCTCIYMYVIGLLPCQ